MCKGDFRQQILFQSIITTHHSTLGLRHEKGNLSLHLLPDKVEKLFSIHWLDFDLDT